MKDPRGIERGTCSTCPCEAYAYDGSSRAACSYCECPAPAHKDMSKELPKRSDSAGLTQGDLRQLSTANSSFTSGSSTISLIESPSPSENLLCFEIPSAANVVGELLTTVRMDTEPNSDEIEKELPKKFPKKVETALRGRNLNANYKSAICQQVVIGLFNNNHDSNSCLEKAARRMVKKWSPLKNPLDPDNRALFEKLRRRRDRLNENERKKETHPGNEDDGLSPSEAAEKMRDDWQAGLRSIVTYRDNMALARPLRKEEAKRTPALQFFRKFPALAITELVLEEFEWEMGTTQAVMIINLKKSVPLIVAYFQENNIECQTGSLDEQLLSVLENLHTLPLWHNKKQANNRTARILETFQENTPLDAMRPGPKDPPRLLCTGSVAEESLTLICYVDTEPFFSVSDPFKATLLLLSGYFLMGIKWPAYTRLPLVLLSCATVGPHKVSGDVSRNGKFQDLLKKLQII